MTACARVQPAVLALRLAGAIGAVSLLLAPPAAGQPAAQTAAPVAQVVSLEGQAAVVHFGASEQLPLAVKSPLLRADTVYTRAASKARIAFEDETVVTLGELASLRVTQIAEPGRGSTRLTVLAGAARLVVKPAPGKAIVETWTPTAIAAVRGTEYIVEVTPDATAVLVVEGTVAVSNWRPDVRGTVILRPGQGTTVRTDRAPQPPAQWGEPRRRSIDERTRLP